ncbi:TFIIH/NER complex subunit [Polyrhizophydium stewartii]|uniref:RNA polymerase II transcription factor B subunit 3 n=1 Tax=Polyrhizophydium stewartii TaxID=2732419 RepID=A0ABR4ND97_9FUNG
MSAAVPPPMPAQGPQSTIMTDNERCPICKSDRYLNPTLRLLVSPCESCINRLFLSGPAPCPICRVTLRKSSFVNQTFDDLYVEKEIQVRRKYGRYFNKRLEDFGGNLRAYNDYLEEVEEIMFNLINDVDVEQTKERIDRFRDENKDIISANISRQLTESKIAARRLELERNERQRRKEAYIAQDAEEAKARKLEQIELIDRLASAASEVDAISIVRESLAKKAPVKGLRPIEVSIEMDEALDEGIDSLEMLLDDTAYEPFDGLYYETFYHTPSNMYTDPMAQQFKSEEKAMPARADEQPSPSIQPDK